MQIKASKHSIKHLNAGKQNNLDSFMTEYKRVLNILVDHIWNTKFTWTNSKKQTMVFNVKTNQLTIPPHINIPNDKLWFETTLSARVISSAINQAKGIVAAATEQRRRDLFVLAKLQKEGSDPKKYKKLQQKIDKTPLVKPNVKSVSAMLSTTCCKFVPGSNKFDGFLVLYSLGKSFGRIAIPVKLHTKHTAKLQEEGYSIKTSWQVSSKSVSSIWERENVPKRTTGIKLGADQGAVTCLTLSDGQVTPKCIHGHDLRSIMMELSRKKPGSKSFKRKQAHRTNYINWAINQLDLTDVKELGFEEVKQIRNGKSSSRFLTRWTYAEIAAKVYDVCEDQGVLVVSQNSRYRSQRCSSCGYVHKSNRKGKMFTCRECDFTLDADLNSALNHEVDLPDVPYLIWHSGLNRKGFFWTPTGFYDQNGKEIEYLTSQG